MRSYDLFAVELADDMLSADGRQQSVMVADRQGRRHGGASNNNGSVRESDHQQQRAERDVTLAVAQTAIADLAVIMMKSSGGGMSTPQVR